ncbi:MAG TPA: phage integrase N-terminal SAM-like domain-containing protein [Prolixibacteraceae bacterium]|nr:phage integrase N-terminal SAM-like domain-containing protein [Prolixibacteraceae bacterium]
MTRKIKVILQPVKFRKRDHIGILSLHSPEVDEIVREFDEAEWSTGYRFWHIPYNPDTYNNLIDKLKEIAVVDHSSYRNYVAEEQPEKQERKKRMKVEEPNPEQKKILKKVETEFLKTYSPSTVKIYICLLNVFFGWFNQKHDDEIASEDVELFIRDYIEKNGYTPNYKRLMKNVLRRYYAVRGKEIHLKP